MAEEVAVVIISDSEEEDGRQHAGKRLGQVLPSKPEAQRPLKRLRRASTTASDGVPPTSQLGQISFSSSQQDVSQQAPAPAAKGRLFALLAAAPPRKNRQQDSRPPKGVQDQAGTKLWSARHVPTKESDLIVHKKKLTALSDFLQLHTADDTSLTAAKLLFITGPPGCGKTISARIVAASLGFEIVEWVAPVPTLWSEHVLQADRTDQYVSKLDGFHSFVAHAKLAPLALASITDPSGAHASKRRKVILVDDLPHAAGTEQRSQLTEAISTLAASARCPVIVIMTTSLSAAERKMSTQGATQLLQSELSRIVEASGGVDLPFNAIPPLAGSKVLLSIADCEGLHLSAQHAKLILENSAGDLLNAIETLQLYGQGKIDQKLLTQRGKKGKKGKSKAGRKDAQLTEENKVSLQPLQRDKNLSTFHALGRLLYNKREGDSGASPEDLPSTSTPSGLLEAGHSVSVDTSQKFDRRQMVYNPEEVVEASGMDPAHILGFVQQNYLDFVEEQAIDDAASASAYFSDADLLLSRTALSGLASEPTEAAGQSIRESCGCSVAARGLMWANEHPAQKRWLPLKASQLYLVTKAAQANLQCLQTPTGAHHRTSETGHQLASEVLPYLRLLTSFPIAAHLRPLLPPKWTRLWQGAMVVESQSILPSEHTLPALDDMSLGDTIEDSDG